VNRSASSRGLGALLAAPAAVALAASPVSAAADGRQWISICTGEGARWISLEDEAGSPVIPPEGDHRGAGCAHATCPRDDRLDRKSRARC
jgi:hypothetical protein